MINLAAAAAAKSLQSCPTLCDPIDGSPLGSSVPGILQARILEWVAISLSSPKCQYSSSPSRVLSLAKSIMKTAGNAKIWTVASGGCLPAPGSSLIASLNSPCHSLLSVEQMLLTCKCYTENLFCARHVPSAIKKKKKKNYKWALVACFNLVSSVFFSEYFRFHPLFLRHKLPLLFGSVSFLNPGCHSTKSRKMPLFSHLTEPECRSLRVRLFFCFSRLSFPNRLFTVFSLSLFIGLQLHAH